MNHQEIIKKLSNNSTVFQGLLNEIPEEEYRWKPQPDQWCLLEVVCHLYDEEREDFRARVKHVLETPDQDLPKFDPLVWVTEREYLKQDYEKKLDEFLKERVQSINWLQSLHDVPWKNFYDHPKFGPLSAEFFLINWLAHDYLHIRQINRIKYQFLAEHNKEKLNYAGDW